MSDAPITAAPQNYLGGIALRLLAMISLSLMFALVKMIDAAGVHVVESLFWRQADHREQPQRDPAQIMLRRPVGPGGKRGVAHMKSRISARRVRATRHPPCPAPPIRLVAHSGLGV